MHQQQKNLYQIMKINAVSVLPRLACALMVFAISGLSSIAANNNPPEFMSYQGYLVDSNGKPLGDTNTGPRNYDVIFRIYDAQTEGNKLWTETQTLTVDKGYFSVLLGEGASVGSESRLPLSTVFTNTTASDRYIEITVKGIGTGTPPGDVTINPRLRLLSSPYAFLARNALNANGAATLVNSGNSAIVNITGTNAAINKTPAAGISLDVNGTINATALSVTTGGANFNSNIVISNKNVLEFGKGVTKQVDAGKIGYMAFESGVVDLDIVGGGTTNTDRKVKIWAEGGTTFTGPISVAGTNSATAFAGYGIVPIGGIIMWSGSVASIPAGWKLCDGNNGTPNLTNRFVIAAGGGYAVGATGGAASVTLSSSQLPSHNHTFRDYFFSESSNWDNVSYADYYASHYPGSGAHDSDNHYFFYFDKYTGSTGGNAAVPTLPPYYALAFIMRTQ